jgi:YD repeat-containing protein
MTRQLDAKGNSDSLTYDVLGRVATEVRSEGTKIYRYDPAGNPGLIDSVTYTGGSEKYIYDTKGRLTSNVIKIEGSNFTTGYGYDSYSRIQNIS